MAADGVVQETVQLLAGDRAVELQALDSSGGKASGPIPFLQFPERFPVKNDLASEEDELWLRSFLLKDEDPVEGQIDSPLPGGMAILVLSSSETLFHLPLSPPFFAALPLPLPPGAS